MKALMFGWEGFPPHNSGGLGMACMGLTRAISREGVELTFVLPKRIPIHAPWCRVVFADRRSGFETNTEDVQKFYSPYVTSEEYSALKEKYPELANLSGSLLEEVMRYAVLARRIAMEEEFDVIHAHDWLTYLAGIEAKAVSGKPLVAHIHATEFDRTGNGGVNQMVYAIERAGLHAADRVIAVSNYTKQVLIKHYGIDPEKIEVVHNGIDHDDPAVSKNPYEIVHALKKQGKSLVLFVGRITLQKGPDYFLQAAKRVIEHRPDTVFLFSGSGDMEQKIIQQAAYYGISDKVLFLGFVRGDARADLYKLADLFVMPSVSEPFGIVPLEALANGTPAIISKHAGVAETVQNVLKVDFWDIDEMANMILAVLNHDSLKQSLGENGLKEVLGVVWQKAATKCVDVYHRVISMFNNQTQT